MIDYLEMISTLQICFCSVLIALVRVLLCSEMQMCIGGNIHMKDVINNVCASNAENGQRMFDYDVCSVFGQQSYHSFVDSNKLWGSQHARICLGNVIDFDFSTTPCMKFDATITYICDPTLPSWVLRLTWPFVWISSTTTTLTAYITRLMWSGCEQQCQQPCKWYSWKLPNVNLRLMLLSDYVLSFNWINDWKQECTRSPEAISSREVQLISMTIKRQQFTIQQAAMTTEYSQVPCSASMRIA